MMNWWKKLILFRLLVNKADYNTKIVEIEKKITDHDKYITTPKFNNWTKKNCWKIKIRKPSMQIDIAYFVKKTDFSKTKKSYFK